MNKIYLFFETVCNKRMLKRLEASWACIKKWVVLLPQGFDSLAHPSWGGCKSNVQKNITVKRQDPKYGPLPSYTNIVWSWLVLWSLQGLLCWLSFHVCNEHLVEMDSQLVEHRGGTINAQVQLPKFREFPWINLWIWMNPFQGLRTIAGS